MQSVNESPRFGTPRFPVYVLLARACAMLSDRAAIRAAHIILASSSPRRVDIFNEILQLDVRGGLPNLVLVHDRCRGS